ncbi:MAG: serine/threonine-protein kinase [Miltoncostaeaceae bacterium]
MIEYVERPDEGPPPRPAGSEIAPGLRILGLINRSRHLDVHDVLSLERAARCVVKVARPDRLDRPRVARRLELEGRLLRRLSHPHIVRGYPAPGAPEPMVVTETLTGATLGNLLHTSTRRLGPAEIAHLGMHVASALVYLHGQGWLHLDLKPGNIVAEGGRAKVIDLSLARRPGRVRAGLGTHYYMSPEQARGGAVGPPADVWGLGVVLWEAAAGRRAFGHPDDDEDEDGTGGPTEGWSGGESEVSRTGSGTGAEDDPGWTESDDEPPQLTRVADPVRRHRRGLPRELAQIIDACLAHAPEDRPELAALLAALEPATDIPAHLHLHSPAPG